MESGIDSADIVDSRQTSRMNTADRILSLLKTRGPQTAQQLATALQLTSMGTRRHLEAWRDAGCIDTEDRSEKIGRPSRYWALTESGHARFPDRHSELTVQIIADVRKLFGEAGLDRLIEEREVQSEARYLDKIGAAKSLGERVAKLADERNAEGYMASVCAQDDGSYLLIEDHCPICAAAQACQGFCRSELTLFQRSLGSDCEVTRTSHLLSGGRRCIYLVNKT
jgi:predicted ArsR family transcriptional regulator